MSKGLVRHVAPWGVAAPAWLARGVFGVSRVMRYAVGIAFGLYLAQVLPLAGIALVTGLVTPAAVIWVAAGFRLRSGARRQLRDVVGPQENLSDYQLIGTGRHMIWLYRQG